MAGTKRECLRCTHFKGPIKVVPGSRRAVGACGRPGGVDNDPSIATDLIYAFYSCGGFEPATPQQVQRRKMAINGQRHKLELEWGPLEPGYDPDVWMERPVQRMLTIRQLCAFERALAQKRGEASGDPAIQALQIRALESQIESLREDLKCGSK